MHLDVSRLYRYFSPVPFCNAAPDGLGDLPASSVSTPRQVLGTLLAGAQPVESQEPKLQVQSTLSGQAEGGKGKGMESKSRRGFMADGWFVVLVVVIASVFPLLGRQEGSSNRQKHIWASLGSNIHIHIGLSGFLNLQRSPNSVIIAQVPLTLAMPLRTSECGGWRQELVGLELGCRNSPSF